ncbi:MAG: TIGR04013 family B12-binding domain/radical SAM domain-containing protein [Myxococcota bacterium]
MKPNLIFLFTQEIRNSISALIAAIRYSNLEKDFLIQYSESSEDILSKIDNSVPNIVLFSITTVNFYDRYRDIKKIIRATEGIKDILYIAGGPHADGDPHSLIKSGFDIVFSGYSEESFSTFLKSYLEAGGVREKGKIIYGKTPFLWNKRSFASFANNYFPPLELQRGCRFRCSYCQSCTRLNKQIYKSREAIDEYITDFLSLGFKRFSFVSPDAFDIRFVKDERSPENMLQLFEYLSSKGIEIIEYGQFPSEIRPHRDTDEYFRVLSKYTKNRKIVIGAQSFVDERLKKIRRGHTSLDIESTMESAHRYGFYSIVDIIIGFPDESPEERHHTLNRFRDLNKRFPSRLHIHYFLPLAGTQMYYENPSPLDETTLRLLDRLERDGRAKGWWREGKRMVEKIIKMRTQFSET